MNITQIKSAITAFEAVSALAEELDDLAIRDMASQLASVIGTLCGTNEAPLTAAAVTVAAATAAAPAPVADTPADVSPAPEPAPAPTPAPAPEPEPAPAADMSFADFAARTHAAIGNPEILARIKDRLIAWGAMTIQDVEPRDRASFLAEAGL